MQDTQDICIYQSQDICIYHAINRGNDKLRRLSQTHLSQTHIWQRIKAAESNINDEINEDIIVQYSDNPAITAVLTYLKENGPNTIQHLYIQDSNPNTKHNRALLENIINSNTDEDTNGNHGVIIQSKDRDQMIEEFISDANIQVTNIADYTHWQLAQLYSDEKGFIAKNILRMNQKSPEDSLTQCYGLHDVWIEFFKHCLYGVDIAIEHVTTKFMHNPHYNSQKSFNLQLRSHINNMRQNAVFWLDEISNWGQWAVVKDDLIITEAHIISLSMQSTVSKLRRSHLLITQLKLYPDLKPRVYSVLKPMASNIRGDKALIQWLYNH